ncbi:MAG TPA: hypothetical protein VFX60_19275 [Micromonospora sp.]|nr:hypothetical protein [Micromonospora sp.]
MKQDAIKNKTIVRKIREGEYLHDETGVRVIRGGDGQFRIYTTNRYGNPRYASDAGRTMKMARRVATGYILRVRDAVAQAYDEAVAEDAARTQYAMEVAAAKRGIREMQIPATVHWLAPTLGFQACGEAYGADGITDEVERVTCGPCLLVLDRRNGRTV